MTKPAKPSDARPNASTPNPSDGTDADPSSAQPHPPTRTEANAAWAQIGFLSFGGPSAQIALLHRVVVEEKKWLDEQSFLHALSFCMLLPGPEAMQLVTYVGWRLHGVIGGVIAGLWFVLPGALVILALSITYALFGNVPLVEAVFVGIKAAVLIIVLEALLRIARRSLLRLDHWALAAASFIALFVFALPYPLIILLAGFYGFAFGSGIVGTASAPQGAPAQSGDEAHAPPTDATISATPAQTLRTLVVGLLIWWLPIFGLIATLGAQHVLSQLALFFSKVSVISFGGAYAVLAYMTEVVVTTFQWIDAGQMLAGLGLAETTPGPLILVTEFVGFLAAFNASTDTPLLVGIAGAIVALWAIFVPCFIWIFCGGPYIAWLNAQPRLREALSAITAAIVGVILNLSIWFSLHVFFQTVTLTPVGPMRLWVPDVASVEWRIIVLASVSGLCLIRYRWSLPAVLGASASLAVLIALVTPA